MGSTGWDLPSVPSASGVTEPLWPFDRPWVPTCLSRFTHSTPLYFRDSRTQQTLKGAPKSCSQSIMFHPPWVGRENTRPPGASVGLGWGRRAAFVLTLGNLKLLGAQGLCPRSQSSVGRTRMWVCLCICVYWGAAWAEQRRCTRDSSKG